MAGVTIDGNVLFLKPVAARHAGSYTCLAKNIVGTSTSNYVNISVLYTPRCNDGWEDITELTTPGEQTRLTCQILAWPISDVSVTWSIVHSDGQEVNLHEGDFLNLDYIPGSNQGSRLRKVSKNALKSDENRGKRRTVKLPDVKLNNHSDYLHRADAFSNNDTTTVAKDFVFSPVNSKLFLKDESSNSKFIRADIHFESINITLNFTSESTTVFCRARNSIGIQETPCRIRLSQAEAPPVSLLTSVAAESTKSVLNCSSAQVAETETIRISCPLDSEVDNNYEIFLLQGWRNNSLLLNISSQGPRWIVNHTLTPNKLELSLTVSNGTSRMQYKVNITTTNLEDGSTGQRPLLVRPNVTWTDKNAGQALTSNAWWHMPVLGVITSLLLVLVFLLVLIIFVRRRKNSQRQQSCHDSHSCLAVTTGCGNRRHSEIGMSTELLLGTVEPATGGVPTKGILKQSTQSPIATTTVTTDFSVDITTQLDSETTLSLASPLENSQQYRTKTSPSSLQGRDISDSKHLIKSHPPHDDKGCEMGLGPVSRHCGRFPKITKENEYITVVDGSGERVSVPGDGQNVVLTSMCSGNLLMVGVNGASANQRQSASYEQLPTVTGYIEKAEGQSGNNLCSDVKCGLQRTNSMPRRLIENNCYFLDSADEGQSPISPLLSKTVITSASSSHKYRTVLSQEHKISRAETIGYQHHPVGTSFPYSISSSISNIFRPPRKPPRPSGHIDDSSNETHLELVNVNPATVASSSGHSKLSDGIYSHSIKTRLPSVDSQSTDSPRIEPLY